MAAERAITNEGAITDEGIARLRARIGIAEPHPVAPHYVWPTIDTFRHVAEAYGDDNPLWSDAYYAERSRWAGPVAPPALVGGDSLVGEDEVTELDADTDGVAQGRPASGRARVLLGVGPRVVGAVAAPAAGGTP